MPARCLCCGCWYCAGGESGATSCAPSAIAGSWTFGFSSGSNTASTSSNNAEALLGVSAPNLPFRLSCLVGWSTTTGTVRIDVGDYYVTLERVNGGYISRFYDAADQLLDELAVKAASTTYNISFWYGLDDAQEIIVQFAGWSTVSAAHRITGTFSGTTIRLKTLTITGSVTFNFAVGRTVGHVATGCNPAPSSLCQTGSINSHLDAWIESAGNWSNNSTYDVVETGDTDALLLFRSLNPPFAQYFQTRGFPITLGDRFIPRLMMLDEDTLDGVGMEFDSQGFQISVGTVAGGSYTPTVCNTLPFWQYGGWGPPGGGTLHPFGCQLALAVYDGKVRGNFFGVADEAWTSLFRDQVASQLIDELDAPTGKVRFALGTGSAGTGARFAFSTNIPPANSFPAVPSSFAPVFSHHLAACTVASLVPCPAGDLPCVLEAVIAGSGTYFGWDPNGTYVAPQAFSRATSSSSVITTNEWRVASGSSDGRLWLWITISGTTCTVSLRQIDNASVIASWSGSFSSASGCGVSGSAVCAKTSGPGEFNGSTITVSVLPPSC